MDPPPPTLGPLPPELTARILLLLPLLSRVRCESVNRAWCAFLRAPACHASIDSRALLRACGVEGCRLRLSGAGHEEDADEDEQAGSGPSTGYALAALASRAGAQLRALTLAGNAYVRALFPVLSRAPPVLAELRVREATVPTLVALLEALCANNRALPPLLEAKHIILGCAAIQAHAAPAPDGLGEDDSAACRLLRIGVGAADLSLRLGLSFLTQLDDDDEMADDARAVRCLRLGRLLALSRWRRVRLALPFGVESSFEGDSASLSTLCEFLLAGMADDGVAALPAVSPATFVFDMQDSVLEAAEAARVAAAAPPHARLLLGRVHTDESDDAQTMLRALRPGRVAAVRLVFDNAEIDAAQLTAALAALLAAFVAVQDEEPLECDGFTLQLAEYLTTDVLALLCAWLRAHPRVLADLQVCIADAVQMSALLAALAGSQLRRLTLGGRGNEQVMLALAAALEAGELPHLVRLQMLPGWALTEASSQAFAQALRPRNSRFELGFPNVAPAIAMAALWPLIAANPASGVPLDAVHSLVQAFMAVGPASATATTAAANALTTQGAPLFEIVQCRCDRCFEAEEAGCGQELSDVAALLLHVDSLVPPATMAALLRPTARVLLLAACVRHARWPGAGAGALKFTPLLHRALLLWSHFGRDADATPRVLGDIAAACMRELPSEEDEEYQPTAALEARHAICAMLLACGLAGGACAQEPRLAAASTWLAEHVGWLLQQRFPLSQEREWGLKLRLEPLEALPELPAQSQCLLDAAQLLSALVRVPVLRAALWRAPTFPTVLHELLRRRWSERESHDDAPEMAAATAYVALANLLQDAQPDERAMLKTGWWLAAEAHTSAALNAAKQSLDSFEPVTLVESAVQRLRDRGSMLRVVAVQLKLPSDRRDAADAAATHVNLIVKELLRKEPPFTTAQLVAALATMLGNCAAQSDGEGKEARVCLDLLRLFLLQHSAAIPVAVLAGVVKPCRKHLLLGASSPNGTLAALVTLLACGAAADAAAALAKARLAAPAVERLLALHAADAGGVSGDEALAASLAASVEARYAAHYLYDAADLPSLVQALTAERPDVVTVLLMRSWTDVSASTEDPTGLLTAAAVYSALARLLLARVGSTCALATLVDCWCAADAATELHYRGSVAKLVGSPVSTHDVLAHLAGEQARLAALRLKWHADAGKRAAAEEAMLHLNTLQQQLLEHLQQRRHLAHGMC